MKKIILLFLTLIYVCISNVYSQHVTFEVDGLKIVGENTFFWEAASPSPFIAANTEAGLALLDRAKKYNSITYLEDGAGVGNIFYGDKGYMVIKGYDTYETYLGEKREKGPSRSEKGELTLHFQNWFDAIRARDMSIQNGTVQTGHLPSALAHLDNIYYRLGRQLEFDLVVERFIGEGESEANSMLSRDYRVPYLLPEIV